MSSQLFSDDFMQAIRAIAENTERIADSLDVLADAVTGCDEPAVRIAGAIDTYAPPVC